MHHYVPNTYHFNESVSQTPERVRTAARAIVSLLLYGRAVNILGASSGAPFAALCSALTALTAIPILGEWSAPTDWAAVILISVGVYIVSGGPLPGGRARLGNRPCRLEQNF